MTYPIYAEDIPYRTTEQMIEVDRAMMADFHIALIQMMENAGRNLAHLAHQRFLAGNPVGKRVVVLAGTGGNGGSEASGEGNRAGLSGDTPRTSISELVSMAATVSGFF
jgi:hypothetical protein